jgi:hypothetical protein
MLLVYPGQRAQPAPLVAVLRAAWDEARKAKLDDIAARTKAGIPLDDETSWLVVDGIIAAVGDARAQQESAALARLGGDLTRATSGNAIIDPGEFVAPEGVDDVVITCVVISQAERLDLMASLADAWSVLADLERLGASASARRAAEEAVLAAQVAICRRVIVEVGGASAPDGSDVWEGIRLAGLLGVFFSAARYFLQLPPGKALRCGLLLSST